MAVSVYDPSGRLKKHALLGTSFAIDPTQKEKRRKFKELYQEAIQFGAQNKEQQQEVLASRFGGYEQEQAGRLAKIAEQKGSFEKELSSIKTPEEQLAAYNFIPPTFMPSTRFLKERRGNVLREFQREYEQKRGDITAAYSSLQEEEAERRKRLADRLDLYNLFLGA